MLPGFKQRLNDECVAMANNDDRYKQLISTVKNMKFYNSVFRSNIVPWVGASLIGKFKSPVLNELTRQKFEEGHIPDWLIK